MYLRPVPIAVVKKEPRPAKIVVLDVRRQARREAAAARPRPAA